MKNQKKLTLLSYNQSHGWSTPTIKNSRTYPERSFPRLLLVPEIGRQPNWREWLFDGLQTIHRLEVTLNLNFKSSRYVKHINTKEHVTSLCSYKFIAKEIELLSSDEEINLLIQESSQYDSEVVKPRKQLVRTREQCSYFWNHRRAIEE